MTPREAWDAAIEAAAKAALRVLIPEDCSAAEAHGRMASSMAAAEAIRSLTPPPTGARTMTPPDEADTEAVARIVGYHFAAIVSGNNQPHMSGDPRNRLPPHKRRWFDDACNIASAAAIAALRERGWRKVPPFPTEKMVQAGCDNITKQYRKSDWEDAKDMAEEFDCIRLFQAMLSAAPEPPA